MMYIIKSSGWRTSGEANRDLGRRWNDDIKIDLRETGCENVSWIKFE
jgi:hypothetical protein